MVKGKEDPKKRNMEIPETLAANVRSYFTKEINEQLSVMTEKEMEFLLKDLMNTRHWIAILKYTSMRTPMLDATLRGTDPIQNPSKMSWAQGAFAGLCDLETYVIDANAPKPAVQEKSDEEPSDNARTEGIII